MNRKRLVPTGLLALLLALGLSVLSCEGPGPVAPEPAPEPQVSSEQASAGLLDDLFGVVGGVLDLTTQIVLGTDGQKYTLVNSLLGGVPDDVRVSRYIDDDGGELSLAGHTLSVPPNAVDRRTRFTMELVTNGFVEVELSATRRTGWWWFSRVEEVGTERDPFDEPVTLTLSYATSKNVDGDDEDDLLNMRRLGDSYDDPHEPLPSQVDEEERTVSSPLEHFSGFCMAM